MGANFVQYVIRASVDTATGRSAVGFGDAQSSGLANPKAGAGPAVGDGQLRLSYPKQTKQLEVIADMAKAPMSHQTIAASLAFAAALFPEDRLFRGGWSRSSWGDPFACSARVNAQVRLGASAVSRRLATRSLSCGEDQTPPGRVGGVASPIAGVAMKERAGFIARALMRLLKRRPRR